MTSCSKPSSCSSGAEAPRHRGRGRSGCGRRTSPGGSRRRGRRRSRTPPGRSSTARSVSRTRSPSRCRCSELNAGRPAAVRSRGRRRDPRLVRARRRETRSRRRWGEPTRARTRDRLPLVDPLDIDRVVEVLVGFARIEKSVSITRPLPRKRNDRVPASRSCTTSAGGEHNAHDEHQEEGPAEGTERNRSAIEHQRTGVDRLHGIRAEARPFEPQANERLAEGCSLEDRGKTSYAAMVTTTKSSDRPCVTSTCRGCRPKGRHREVAGRVPRARTRVPTST